MDSGDRHLRETARLSRWNALQTKIFDHDVVGPSALSRRQPMRSLVQSDAEALEQAPGKD
jgi:hypothetical protein